MPPSTPPPSNQAGRATPPPAESSGFSRREFMQTLGVTAAAGAAEGVADAVSRDDDDLAVIGPDPATVRLSVNGQPLETTIEPATTLMDALRWHLDLTGTKEVCDRGACGGCSVLVDGKLVASCMMLALDAVGTEVTTIEGLAASDGTLDPIQEAFIKHDALQCGFCTPGLVIASKALLAQNPAPSLAEIKAGLAGNLCRCGTYSNVFNAVLEASGQSPIQDPMSGRA